MRLEIKVWGPSWWGNKPLHFFYVDYHRIVLGPNPKNGTTLARAAIQTKAVRLNTIIASEVILNKTSRRNTVFQKKRILIASRRKKWLLKEFNTARRERS